jgi:outer membrane protein
MKKSLLVVALLSAFAPMVAQAEAGDIVVRLRATNVNPNTKSTLGETTDATYAAGPYSASQLYGDSHANLEVGKNTIPELDISYYFTKNIAAELILAAGTRHSVNVSAGTNPLVTPELGKVNLLPPTLTAQWHFNQDQMIDPYVGAGGAFVLGLDRKLNGHVTALNADLPIRIDRSAFGAVLQAGFDVNLQDKWLVNFDVKKIWFNTDVKIDATPAQTLDGYQKIDNLRINPLVVSVGIGKKF